MSTNSILFKLTATADILGGEVFFADEHGADPENINATGLYPNGMYIRLKGSDESVAYISARELDTILDNLHNSTVKTANDALTIARSLSNSTASKSDIEYLKSQLNDTVSSVAFNSLKNDVETKAEASRVTALENTFNGKASQAQVDELIEIINNKGDKSVVDSLVENMQNKANQTDVANLFAEVQKRVTYDEINTIIADIDALKATVGVISDKGTISVITDKIKSLEDVLNTKLKDSDLDVIRYNITTINKNVNAINQRLYAAEDNLTNTVSKPELFEALTDVNESINNLNVTLNTKADKTELANKASKVDVNSISDKLSYLNKNFSEFKDSSTSLHNSLETAINAKADKASTKASIDSINATLLNKVNLADYDKDKYDLVTTVNDTKEYCQTSCTNLQETIDEFACEINSAIALINTIDNTQTNRLDQHDKTINSLQQKTNTHAEQLKQPWVRVLSTVEYNRLADPPSNVTTYSSIYRYPNIIYFVVDYNRPKAIYIGKIQIAKAEPRGSVGFSYTFPISF